MKNQILRLLVLQYSLGMLYLAITSLMDLSSVLSALTGCLAALVPSTYFSLRMLRTTENDSAAQWLGYVYRSEFGKWAIMGAIFMLAFMTDYRWDPVIMFVGFGVIQISGWLAPFVIKGN